MVFHRMNTYLVNAQEIYTRGRDREIKVIYIYMNNIYMLTNSLCVYTFEDLFLQLLKDGITN